MLLEKIRNWLKQNGYDAAVVNHADEFLNEYLTPDKEKLKAVTGFSGSAGEAIITQTDKMLFTDSRYTEQAREQSDFTVIESNMNMGVDWAKEHLKGKKIAFYAKSHSTAWIQYVQEQLAGTGITLVPIFRSPVESFWVDRPAPVKAKTMNYPLEYAGMSTEEKLRQVAAKVVEQNMDAVILGSAESVSWLLNKRGFSNPQCPIFLERGVVFADGTYQKLTTKVLDDLTGKRVMTDFRSFPYDLYARWGKIAHVVNKPDPVAALKAVKNPIEIENIKEACLFESAVICEFLAYVETHKNTATELTCAMELVRLRKKNPLYIADSFDAIVASGPHAALAHYHADMKSSVNINAYPMLLVDTGGQYLNGTTDMTRTICIDKPSELMKRRYTEVLKGHIALAASTIKTGDVPVEIDKKAHQFLRADGADYYHATGHGIGMFLSVHESPPTIHERSKTPIVANMVFSNEPAVYDVTNGFGIRLENMLLSIPYGKGELAFENLTFIPFDGRLVDFGMLTSDEKNWLRSYHKQIMIEIFPRLKPKTREILIPLIDCFL